MKATCNICPHGCQLNPEQLGFCGARKNTDGIITAENYGKITSIGLDPIEKKPLARFMPGSKILSVGSYGCNLRCPFCQNHSISTAKEEDTDCIYVTPGDLAKKAYELVPDGNIGLAYTYNEPLIGYEFIYDCSLIIRDYGLKNVIVTAGFINEEPLLKLLPLTDAMNIDVKAFTDTFYKKLRGDLETVKNTVTLASRYCHTELTTLIVPEENDSPEEIENLSAWIASISKNIPLHISRFFPQHKYLHKQATPVDTIYNLAEVARKYLNYVFVGNC